MPNPTLTSRTILVVEDNEDLREILNAKLTADGYRVTTAANGQDAAKELIRERFDLVLTDWFMPAKGGLEVLRELYTSHPTLPVVVMSGGGLTMSAAQCMGSARLLGSVAVLKKPFSDEQLRLAIAQALPERPS
jgi:CheY-like chemotaxis protein